MGIQRHDEIVCDKRKNDGVTYSIQHRKNRSPMPAPRRIGSLFRPDPVKVSAYAALADASNPPERHGIVKITKTQSIENDKPDQIPDEQGPNVKPCTLPSQLHSGPWKNVVPSQKENRKQENRNREKS